MYVYVCVCVVYIIYDAFLGYLVALFWIRMLENIKWAVRI